MPTILRRSGPDFIAKDGTAITPRAMVHFCETCGFEGAAYGIHKDGKLLSWCGEDRDHNFLCIGRGNQQRNVA